MNTTETVQQAAQHFINLYTEEIAAGQATKDAIYEWWGQTKDQYPDAIYEDVEKEILSNL